MLGGKKQEKISQLIHKLSEMLQIKRHIKKPWRTTKNCSENDKSGITTVNFHRVSQHDDYHEKSNFL